MEGIVMVLYLYITDYKCVEVSDWITTQRCQYIFRKLPGYIRRFYPQLEPQKRHHNTGYYVT